MTLHAGTNLIDRPAGIRDVGGVIGELMKFNRARAGAAHNLITRSVDASGDPSLDRSGQMRFRNYVFAEGRKNDALKVFVVRLRRGPPCAAYVDREDGRCN